MKRYILSAAMLGLLLSSCQSAGSDPKGAVNGYLKALKNDSADLQEFICNKDAPAPSDSLTGVKSWKIVSISPTVGKYDPDDRYNLISVQIESMSASGFLVTRTWNASVWQSDELLESQKRTTDRINQTVANGVRAINQVRQMTGEAPEPERKSLEPPDRSHITSHPYCVTKIEPVQS